MTGKKLVIRLVGYTTYFFVQTDEGELYCEDGWIAEDSRGFPYPIDKKEFENIYVEAKENNG